MDKYDRLYEIGEEHLLSLMKIECPRSILGLSNHIVFNENDSLTITGEIILFHLNDGNNTFSCLINRNANTFQVTYYETDDDDIDSEIFKFRRVPYDITEEWHFQLCTQKNMPFTFEFHTKLKEYVEICSKVM